MHPLSVGVRPCRGHQWWSCSLRQSFGAVEGQFLPWSHRYMRIYLPRVWRSGQDKDYHGRREECCVVQHIHQTTCFELWDMDSDNPLWLCGIFQHQEVRRSRFLWPRGARTAVKYLTGTSLPIVLLIGKRQWVQVLLPLPWWRLAQGSLRSFAWHLPFCSGGQVLLQTWRVLQVWCPACCSSHLLHYCI